MRKEFADTPIQSDSVWFFFDIKCSIVLCCSKNLFEYFKDLEGSSFENAPQIQVPHLEKEFILEKIKYCNIFF